MKLPKFTPNIDYMYVDNIVELKPFDYPKVNADPLMTALNITEKEAGKLEKKYRKKWGNSGFQHQIYNCYVAF